MFSSAAHTGQYSFPLPSVMIDCDDDKENIPSESDYEDLPSMYKEDDEEEDEEDEEDDEEGDDDSLFTSKLIQYYKNRTYEGSLSFMILYLFVVEDSWITLSVQRRSRR